MHFATPFGPVGFGVVTAAGGESPAPQLGARVLGGSQQEGGAAVRALPYESAFGFRTGGVVLGQGEGGKFGVAGEGQLRARAYRRLGRPHASGLRHPRPTAPGDSVALLALTVVLLGLGCNLGLVSGTAIVSDAVPLTTRAKTQGLVDVAAAIAGAAGGMASGLVAAAASYSALATTGAVLAHVLLPVIIATTRKR